MPGVWCLIWRWFPIGVDYLLVILFIAWVSMRVGFCVDGLVWVLVGWLCLVGCC